MSGLLINHGYNAVVIGPLWEPRTDAKIHIVDEHDGYLDHSARCGYDKPCGTTWGTVAGYVERDRLCKRCLRVMEQTP